MLTIPDETQGELNHWWPEILPGGRAVLFTIIKGGDENRDIALLDLEGGETTVLIPDGTNPRYAATGHIVYGRDGALWAVPFDLDRLEVMGDPVRVLEGIMIKSTGAVNFALSSTGSLVYAVGGSPGLDTVMLAWMDRVGELETIPTPPQA